jgi:hypothetical protein
MLQADGYPVINTEFISNDSGSPDGPPLIHAFETGGISWCWFDYTGVWTPTVTLGNAHNEQITPFGPMHAGT